MSFRRRRKCKRCSRLIISPAKISAKVRSILQFKMGRRVVKRYRIFTVMSYRARRRARRLEMGFTTSCRERREMWGVDFGIELRSWGRDRCRKENSQGWMTRIGCQEGESGFWFKCLFLGNFCLGDGSRCLGGVLLIDF